MVVVVVVVVVVDCVVVDRVVVPLEDDAEEEAVEADEEEEEEEVVVPGPVLFGQQFDLQLLTGAQCAEDVPHQPHSEQQVPSAQTPTTPFPQGLLKVGEGAALVDVFVEDEDEEVEPGPDSLGQQLLMHL